MIHDIEPAAPDWMGRGAELLCVVANIAIKTRGTQDTVRIENVTGNRIALSVTSGNEVLEVFYAFEPHESSVTRGVELRDWLQRCGLTVKAVGFPVVRR